MRVLLLNQVFHPDPQAPSQYLSRLALGFVRQGHEVTVLTGCRDYEEPGKLHPAQETWQGVQIIRVWNTGLGHRSKLGRMVDFLSFLFVAFLRGLFLKRADVVIALTTPPLISVLGAILSSIWNVRFIYWVMDLNPDEAIAVGWLKPRGIMARFLETASRWSLRAAHKIVVPDVYMRDRVRGKAIPAEKLEVIPLWAQSGVAFDAAGRERFRRAHGLGDKFVVMYAGNHTPCHPLDPLMESARLLRGKGRIHFCFVGGGMDWPRLQAETQGWPNITFLGYQPEADLSALLSAADLQIVVMGEPFVGIIHPCKAYNFIAAQRPFLVIGPERSHLADLIRDGGLAGVSSSFPPGETSALAKEILRRATTPESPLWPDSGKLAPWSEKAILARWMPLIAGSK